MEKQTIHPLNDFPYFYTTSDNTPETEKSEKSDLVDESHTYWQNDPNHNIEPKSPESDKPDTEYFSDGTPMAPISDKFRDLLNKLEKDREIKLTLDEFNKVGKSVFQLESDKRVERYFLTKQGEVWLVTHITDIPEKSANPAYAHIMRKSPTTGNSWGFVAKDGMLTMVTAALYFTRERAMESIQEDVEFLTKFAHTTEEPFLSHVYELDTVA